MSLSLTTAISTGAVVASTSAAAQPGVSEACVDGDELPLVVAAADEFGLPSGQQVQLGQRHRGTGEDE